MNFYNVNNTNELISAKFEYSKEVNKDISIEDFVNKLDLTSEIFIYQDKNNNIQVIPFKIIKDNVYCSNANKDEKIYDEFKSFANNYSKLELVKKASSELIEESLSNRFYIIKSNEIYVWE